MELTAFEQGVQWLWGAWRTWPWPVQGILLLGSILLFYAPFVLRDLGKRGEAVVTREAAQRRRGATSPTTHDIGLLAGLAVGGTAGVALASSGMPWEAPLQTVASSITGVGGVSACTIGIAWTGINWGRGTEHGKEAFIGTTVGTGLTLGAAKMVSLFGGGAGGAPLIAAQALPMATFLNDLVGELLGHGVYAAWLFGGLLLPLTWRKRACVRPPASRRLSTRA